MAEAPKKMFSEGTRKRRRVAKQGTEQACARERMAGRQPNLYYLYIPYIPILGSKFLTFKRYSEMFLAN